MKVLIGSILLGGFFGFFLGDKTYYLKPLGDIFLNLIFTAVVPLIFFSIASAISKIKAKDRLAKLLFRMTLVFVGMSSVAAIFALAVVKVFPPAFGVNLTFEIPQAMPVNDVSSQIVSIFTVSEFSKLLSHEHMLALILFSILLGRASIGTGFESFLKQGEEVFMKLFSLIMKVAPIGFFAYFAVLVHKLGPSLAASYMRVTVLYYVSVLIYFVVIYSLCAYWAAKKSGLFLFWKNISLPVTTSLGTCSSVASIPANMVAARAMKIAPEIYETVMPLGGVLHKQGSVMGGMFKIAFLFGVFGLDFSGASVLLLALLVSLLVGTVMGAIPSGGMLGEILILSIYGFPPSTLVVISIISILIDPIATMLNVTGNTIGSMLLQNSLNQGPKS